MNIFKMIHTKLMMTLQFHVCNSLQDFQALAESLWHGHIHDRWFDKSINVSVCAGANAGSNIEHSLLDAMVRSRKS